MKTVTYSDFDAFSDSVSDVDCVMTVHSPTYRTWVLHQAQLPNIHVQLGRLGSGNIVVGSSNRDSYLLYLPLTRDCQYRANGRDADTSKFMVLEPASEFHLSTHDSHDWCSISFSSDSAAEYGLREAPAGDGPGRCRVSGSHPDLALQFRSAISELIKGAIKNPNLEATQAAAVAEKHLMGIAASLLRDTPLDQDGHAGRPRLSRQAIIGRCRDQIEQCRDSCLTIADLTAACGVSDRTLREAFQAYFGMGPKRYLKLRQLNRVYRELRASDPDEQKVSDCLLRHGILEHGRFAAEYKELFSEPPSATLQASKRSRSSRSLNRL
jgi:AraC-like DNA-binding protein